MKKQLRNIIIAVCVVAVLAGGVVLLSVLVKPKPSSSSSASSASSTPSVTVLKVKQSDMTELDVKNSNGSFTLRQKDGKFSVDEIKNAPLNNDSLNTTFGSAADITATAVIAENAADLSQYGLTNPKVVIKYTAAGVSHEIDVGNATPDAAGNYVRVDGNNKVYKCDSSLANYFSGKAFDYANLTLSTISSSDIAKLSAITLGGTARSEEITLKAEASSSTTSSGSAATYDMIAPASYPTNPDNMSTLTTALESLSASNLIEDGTTEAALKKYGLDKAPYTLAYTFKNQDYKLSFGNPFEDNGTTYVPVMLKGTDAIYRIDTSSITWYNWGMKDVTSTMLITPYIDTVSSITVTQGSESYTINLTGTDQKLKGTYGTTTLNTDYVRSFYAKAIGITFEGAATAPKDGTPYCTVTVNYRSASQKPSVMKFIPIDSRRYFWSLDGKGYFYVLRDQLDTMLAATRNLVAGKAVS